VSKRATKRAHKAHLKAKRQAALERAALKALSDAGGALSIGEYATLHGVTKKVAQETLRQAQVDTGASHAVKGNNRRKSVHDDVETHRAGMIQHARTIRTYLSREATIADEKMALGLPFDVETMELAQAIQHVQAVVAPLMDRAIEGVATRIERDKATVVKS